jgi:polyhydroxyalkanoate synthesis regulator phasin
MFSNKKLAVAVSGAVLLMAGQFALADSTTDIVDALVSKGVLTEEEGKLISKGAVSKAKADEKANKSRISVGSFIDNATMYGNVRVRAEHRDGKGYDKGTPFASNEEDRDRGRYKLEFGIETKSGKWYSDLAFAMGSGGRSDNATFSGAKTIAEVYQKEALYVKRAMLGFKANDWLTLEAGRIKNPLYTTPMVWDADLTMDGAAAMVNYKMGNTDLFLTGVASQYVGDHKQFLAGAQTADRNANYMLAVQGGLKTPITENSSGKIAMTYTAYTQEGYTSANNAFTKFTTGAPGVNAATTTWQAVNDLDTIEIPAEINYMTGSEIGLRLYGDYVYNMSGTDRYNNDTAHVSSARGDDKAWLLGFVVGSAKDLKAFEGNKMKAGDWQGRIWYQDVGVYSLDNNLTDSDFFDGRLNIKGEVFKAQYNIEDNVFVNFAYGHGTRKNKNVIASGISDIDLDINNMNLWQLDLTYKF